MRWTKAEIEWLKKIYPHTPNAEIARRCGRTERDVCNKGWYLGLKKSYNHREGGFKPGQKAWNKGLKGFKPQKKWNGFVQGHVPHTAKAPGLHQSKMRGKMYWFIKEEGAREMEPYHRYLWRKEHGEIPAGYVIVFRNGDTLDCRIDNLECISRGELTRRNQLKVDQAAKGRKISRLKKGLTFIEQVLKAEL